MLKKHLLSTSLRDFLALMERVMLKGPIGRKKGGGSRGMEIGDP
jgi:hypothetical protein